MRCIIVLEYSDTLLTYYSFCMKNNILLLLTIFFLATSCSNKTKAPEQVLSAQHVWDLNLSKATPVRKLSEVCDSISWIKLETRDDVIVGNVNKLLINSSRIILSSNNNLFIFDSDGKFLSKIDKRGRARDEYLELDDFCVMPNGNILITDAQSQKIILYRIDGTHLNTLTLDFFPESIEALNESVVVVKCSGNYGKRVKVIDTKSGIILKEYFDYEEIFSEPVSQALSKYENEVYYKKPFYNEYYSINHELGLTKKYSFNFYEYNFNKNDLKSINFFGANSLYDSKGNVNVIRFFDLPDIYILEFECRRISEDSQFMLFSSKESSLQYILDSKNYEDDMLFYDYVILPQLRTIHNNKMAGVIYPAAWKEMINDVDAIRISTKQYEKIKETVDKIDGFQNPIIAFYHISLTK